MAQEAAPLGPPSLDHTSPIKLDKKKSVQATQSFLASTHIIPVSQNPFASTHIIPITPNPSPTTDQPPSHPMVTRSNNHIIKPKKFTDGIVRYPLLSALLAKSTDVVSCPKPTCYTLAVKDPNWRAAMNLEFDALLKNQTWVLFPPHVLGIPSAVNGYFELSNTQMALLNTTKPILRLKDFIKYLAWILVRLLVLLLNQPWYVQFYLLLFREAGLFVNLMFRKQSYMAIYLKMFICLNL